ncbi:hypothetical protein TEA_005910 [Camellia sinensis var. sinensis]|uniref:Cyclin N-terminal domain-containing protein n=1 Tax=Camellia sinensis var. sinensis TaxID=542762 RepID=A0A4S4E6L0_CAMSN|nr:hypothetical protein TEA_005910 [Camellia sinensis var. sinensis]
MPVAITSTVENSCLNILIDEFYMLKRLRCCSSSPLARFPLSHPWLFPSQDRNHDQEQIKWDQIVKTDLQKLIQFHFNQFVLAIKLRRCSSSPLARFPHSHPWLFPSQGNFGPSLLYFTFGGFFSVNFLRVLNSDRSEEYQGNAGQEGSSRKKSQTLTSVLNARSKAACDLTDKPKPKPKEQIVDINAADIDNELAVVEYVEDIYKFYKQVENESRVHDYMDSQPEINEKIRAILVDWLIEVHNKFELMPETLYLTINIVDCYLASKSVMRRELQAYTNEQVLITEKRILRELEWSLTVPTPYVFLARFIKAAVADQHMENMVYFLAELGIMNYATIIYCPSMLAASAVYTARCTLNKSPAWNDTLKLHTGFSETQLMDFAKLLVSFHLIAAENKLKVIYRKWKMNGSSN